MNAQRGGLALLASARFATARLVEGFPHIFLRDLDAELRPVFTFLEAVGVPNESLGIVLLLFPPVLMCNADRDLHSRLRTLKKVGFHTSQFFRSDTISVKSLHDNFMIVFFYTTVVMI